MTRHINYKAAKMVKKFLYLDSLRGIACLMVIFSHLTLMFFPVIHGAKKIPNAESFQIQWILNQSPFGVIWSGSAAVYIFFVLSGFVLTHSFMRKPNPALPRLFLSRYLRLMIPSLFSAILALFVFMAFRKNMTGIEGVSPWLASLIIPSPNLIDALFNGAIRPFLKQISNYNVVLWTMGIELWGSFIVYLFCFFQRKKKTVFCLIGAAIILIGVGLFDKRLSFGLLCFIIGLGYYQLRLQIQSSVLAVIVLMLGMYLAGVKSSSLSYPMIDTVLGHNAVLLINIASAPLIVLGILSLPKAQSWLEQPFLIMIGKRSFSIYLIHLPIFIVVVTIAENLFSFSTFFELKILLLSAAMVSLTVVLAGQMNRIDRMAMKVSKIVHR